jgi:hypothetical protein
MNSYDTMSPSTDWLERGSMTYLTPIPYTHMLDTCHHRARLGEIRQSHWRAQNLVEW